ncbi:16S rRNA (cytosine(1402)-N(4))-methyltransferase [Candidatus Endobugula sertula]|uniref:Ribosomal RNA small subunit methyltransferase H n=1 Tax=Candidatus Endobugula sertula TaxID=62101 RepID=A0A1D2QTL8_9GAMM|nr:16S rRNA (cytosine(1402)-N(4))-methyltransferase [Candidatus Endobugula sertula]
MSQQEHMSVLLAEAVDALITHDNGFYIDGTFGRGGHSAHILQRLGTGAQLMAIDKDIQAIVHAQRSFGHDKRFFIHHGSFVQMNQWLEERSLLGKVAGILLDLGVSSPQLDQAERGFSFTQEGPLDMRMNNQSGETAADWLNRADETDIAWVLKNYGEERFAKRMARAVVTERKKEAITTTQRLAKIITKANPVWEKRKHPATRAFQAIRIFINQELQDLDNVLEQSLAALKVGGRLVVISFHSLEDRRVKHFIRQQTQGDSLPKGVPVRDEQLNKRVRKIGKVVKASRAELERNPRARSAVMRVAEKIM